MDGRSVRWGVAASAGMAGLYVGVLAWGSGWSHVTTQTGQDWYLVAPIVAGFGVQVALMAELRRRHRLHAAEATAGGAGAGSSAVGMAACCAHHLAEVAPFAGATGAAALLADYRVAFMVAGIAVNSAGITVAGRRLRELTRHHSGHAHAEGEHACARI